MLLAGRVAARRVADWIGAADVVCQPSLVEPFGQALLEALASERRSSRRGSAGRPSSCRPRPACSSTRRVDSIAAGLAAARGFPRPESRGARRRRAEHDVRVQAERIASVLAAAAQ